MRRFLVVMALVLAACGGDDEESTTSSTTGASSTTTTTAGASSTTSAGATSTTTTTAEPGTDLEDGEHAVFMAEVDVPARTVTVDVVQWLTGDAANEAYEEETGDPSGVPNDYFIVNDNPRLRTLDVSDDVAVEVVALDVDADADLEPLPFADLPAYIDRQPTPEGITAWVTLDSGVVTRIEEQYRP